MSDNASEYDLFIDSVTTYVNRQKLENKPVLPSELIDELNGCGYQVIDTKGLPFNGTTYEVRKPIDGKANCYEVCGHYKHIRQIYGNGLTFYFYPPSCKGGFHLNRDELEEYTFKVGTYDPT